MPGIKVLSKLFFFFNTFMAEQIQTTTGVSGEEKKLEQNVPENPVGEGDK